MQEKLNSSDEPEEESDQCGHHNSVHSLFSSTACTIAESLQEESLLFPTADFAFHALDSPGSEAWPNFMPSCARCRQFGTASKDRGDPAVLRTDGLVATNPLLSSVAFLFSVSSSFVLVT